MYIFRFKEKCKFCIGKACRRYKERSLEKTFKANMFFMLLEAIEVASQAEAEAL